MSHIGVLVVPDSLSVGETDNNAFTEHLLYARNCAKYCFRVYVWVCVSVCVMCMCV